MNALLFQRTGSKYFTFLSTTGESFEKLLHCGWMIACEIKNFEKGMDIDDMIIDSPVHNTNLVYDEDYMFKLQ